MVFDEVHSDLESAGYEVQAVVIPAAAVNAPHGRDRVWFVATNTQFKSEGSDGGTNDETQRNIRRGNEGDVSREFCSNGNVTDAESSGISEQQGSYRERQNRQLSNNGTNGSVTNSTSPGGKQNNGNGKPGLDNKKSTPNNWDNFPTQSPICGGDDGLPTELDGITFSKWRNESIKAYGNAIVPQVAYEIFKAIQRTI